VYALSLIKHIYLYLLMGATPYTCKSYTFRSYTTHMNESCHTYE